MIKYMVKTFSLFVVNQTIVVQTVTPDAIPCHTERSRSTKRLSLKPDRSLRPVRFVMYD